MTSAVEICNLALQLVGADAITSLTENSKAARQCNLAYAVWRDSELRRYMWSFAIMRAQLAASTIPTSTSDLFGYTYAYELPSDCLRFLPPDPNEGTYMTDWKIEKNIILTDTGAPLQIRYLQRITDPAAFDSCFMQVLAARIGLVICEAMTQSSTKKNDLREHYREVLLMAKNANAYQNLPISSPADTWDSVRY